MIPLSRLAWRRRRDATHLPATSAPIPGARCCTPLSRHEFGLLPAPVRRREFSEL